MLDILFEPHEIFEAVSERLPDKLASFEPPPEKGFLSAFDSIAWYCEQYNPPKGFLATLERLWNLAEGYHRNYQVYITTRILKAVVGMGADPSPFIERMDICARHVAACRGILPLEDCYQLLEDAHNADDEIAGEIAVQKLREVIADREERENNR